MSNRTLPKKRFTVEEALALCMSDDEDIGAIGDSDSEGEYEELDIGDADAEPQQIAAQEAIHEEFQFHGFEIEAVAPVERPKEKRNDGPITSLDRALDESNFTPFGPRIPSPTLESEIDNVQYKWVASTSLTSGRNNAANILPLPTGPRSGAKYKKVAIDIWSEFITSEIITTILMYTNGKIHRVIAELPDEMKNNDKYSHIKEVTETELLAFFGFYYATYNKDKPAKYGINFRSLGSSRRPYVFYTFPYAGK